MENKFDKEFSIRKYLINLYTREDLDKFFTEVKDRDNEALMNNIMLELESESRNNDDTHDDSYSEYRQEAQLLLKQLRMKAKISLHQVTLYVSALAAVLFLAISTFQYFKTKSDHSVLYTQTETSYGEKKHIVFSDYSHVILNSQSNIYYPDSFNKKERRIKLSGEAYFDVSKDKTPFIVETDYFDVKVLGTAFNVKAYEDDENISVIVNEGRAEVSMHEATFILKRNEKVTLNTRTGDIIKEIDANSKHSFAWTEDWLYFDHTTIRDIARELERIYGCNIIFKESQDFNNVISGGHDNNSLESVLKSIKYTSGINYTIKENEVLLFK